MEWMWVMAKTQKEWTAGNDEVYASGGRGLWIHFYHISMLKFASIMACKDPQMFS